MKRSGILWLSLLLGLSVLVLLCCLGTLVVLTGGRMDTVKVSAFPSDGVALVEINGVIASNPQSYPLALTGQALIETLRRADRDPQVRAILLYIDSPGGDVVASDEVYKALKSLEKPVVAYLGEIAASGAYYIACGADKIVAHPASLTGSIGVIVEMPNAQKLMEKLGVEMVVIKSGPHKDEGSFYRGLTEEEKAYWQALVEKVHQMFVEVVAKERGLPEEKVKSIADGRVFLGEEAFRLGLVDELGNFDDALKLAGELGGIKGQPRLIRYRAIPGLLESLLGGLKGLLGLNLYPRLMFKFAP